jgi:hypothetical protein
VGNSVLLAEGFGMTIDKSRYLTSLLGSFTRERKAIPDSFIHDSSDIEWLTEHICTLRELHG